MTSKSKIIRSETNGSRARLCVLDLSCIHILTHERSFYRIDAVNNELYEQTLQVGVRRVGRSIGQLAFLVQRKRAKPFTINSYFDGFYKIYTVKQMVYWITKVVKSGQCACVIKSHGLE